MVHLCTTLANVKKLAKIGRQDLVDTWKVIRPHTACFLLIMLVLINIRKKGFILHQAHKPISRLSMLSYTKEEGALWTLSLKILPPHFLIYNCLHPYYTHLLPPTYVHTYTVCAKQNCIIRSTQANTEEHSTVRIPYIEYQNRSWHGRSYLETK